MQFFQGVKTPTNLLPNRRLSIAGPSSRPHHLLTAVTHYTQPSWLNYDGGSRHGNTTLWNETQGRLRVARSPSPTPSRQEATPAVPHGAWCTSHYSGVSCSGASSPSLVTRTQSGLSSLHCFSGALLDAGNHISSSQVKSYLNPCSRPAWTLLYFTPGPYGTSQPVQSSPPHL